MADRPQFASQLVEKVTGPAGGKRRTKPGACDNPRMRCLAIATTRMLRLPIWRQMLIWCVLCLLVLCGWSRGALAEPAAASATEGQAQLQAALDLARQRSNAPGAVVCLAGPSTAQYAASGVVDIASGRPVEVDDCFAIGSLTKMFVAVTVLQLAQEGRLGLDDALAQFIPDFPRAEAITIRMLLGHRSGIGDPTRVFFYDGAGSVGRQSLMTAWLVLALGQQWTPEQLTALIASAAPDAPPGVKGEYSNGNYVLLGRVIENVTGRQVSQEIRSRILDPLGMAQTVFAGEEELPATDMRCYAWRAGQYFDCRPLENASFAWTAGAMVSNARDLLVFSQALFSGRLLAQPWMDQMLTFLPVTGLGGYGLGVTRYGSGVDEAWGHTGRTVGFSACLWYYPASGRTEIVLANLQRCDLGGILRQLR